MNPSNCTLSAIAAGTFDQSCRILCKPAKWNDLAIFYIGNYIAHAVTVRKTPGQSTPRAVANIVSALLFPAAGLVEGIRAIASRAVFAKTPLQTAARAGALYAVAKDRRNVDRSPLISVKEAERMVSSNANQLTSNRQSINTHEVGLRDIIAAEHTCEGTVGDSIAPARTGGDIEAQLNQETIRKLLDESYLQEIDAERKIHGRVSLPLGWILVAVPWDATFEDDDAISNTEKAAAIQVSQDYSVTKSATALGQALYAISTLYDTRGNQIKQFGYAAFGFAVVPYAFMSIVNLLGNLMCPEYPAMYIVESDDLGRLRERITFESKESKFYVEGTVGKLRAQRNSSYEMDGYYTGAYVVGLFGLIGIHIGLIGGLTKFHKEDSTYAQRIWMMTWLGLGDLFGFYFGFFQLVNVDVEGWVILMLGACAVGGFVVVGKMILQLGICEQI